MKRQLGDGTLAPELPLDSVVPIEYGMKRTGRRVSTLSLRNTVGRG
jgi:hypothetical protein